MRARLLSLSQVDKMRKNVFLYYFLLIACISLNSLLQKCPLGTGLATEMIAQEDGIRKLESGSMTHIIQLVPMYKTTHTKQIVPFHLFETLEQSLLLF